MNERGRRIMEQIRKDRPNYTKKTLLSREIIAEEDPEYLELFHRMHMHVVHENNNLPTKIKEIIITAVDAANGYGRGVKIHIIGALAAGATKKEIFEGLQAASMPAGIHVLSVALPILKEVLEEWEEKEDDAENK